MTDVMMMMMMMMAAQKLYTDRSVKNGQLPH
jgi:hypothetical protein